MYVNAKITKGTQEIERLKKNIKSGKLVFKSGVQRKRFYLYTAEVIRERAYYYAPKNTGFMADNIKVIDSPDGIGVASFAPYSIYVHEIMENKHQEPTQAKFLEDAALEIENMLGGAITINIIYFPVLMILINSSKGTSISQIKEDESYKFNELARELVDYSLKRGSDMLE